MRLRKSIPRPDRFDEIVFRSKHHDHTIPLYPDLLAAQVIPFDPSKRPASFPSLPLVTSPDLPEHRQTSELKNDLPLECIDGSQPGGAASGKDGSCDVQNGANSPNCSRRQGLTRDIEITTSCGDVSICIICHRKKPVAWNSLALSVQVHIFTTFLRYQKYAEVVARTLGLSNQELDDIRYQINLRQIYHTPLQTIWDYGSSLGTLGPDIVNPDQINNLMGYLLFASRYDCADEIEVQRGRHFLRHMGFDDRILNAFIDQHEANNINDKTKPSARTPPSNIRKRRRGSSMISHIAIDTIHANTSGGSRCSVATAPASIVNCPHLTPRNGKQSAASNRFLVSPALPSTPQEAEGKPYDQTHSSSKRMRLTINSHGFATITRSPDKTPVLQHGSSGSIFSTTTTPAVMEEEFLHPNHNSTAFARHFRSSLFPASVKVRLQKQDPRKMSSLDHWLIYGSSWKCTHYVVHHGLTPKPADMTFEPRETLLDGSALQSPILIALVNLHNIWVQRNAWKEEDHGELTRKFDHMAESLMEEHRVRCKLPSISSEDSRAETSKKPTRTCRKDTPESQGPIDIEATSRHAPKEPIVCQASPHMLAATVSVHPGPSDSHITLPSDSCLTKINALGHLTSNTARHKSPALDPSSGTMSLKCTSRSQASSEGLSTTENSIIRSGKPSEVIARQILGQRDRESKSSDNTEQFQKSISGQALNALDEWTPVDLAQVASDSLHIMPAATGSVKAPSFSPISEQDPASLPAWVQNAVRFERKDSTTLTTNDNKNQSLWIKPKSAISLQKNKFLRELMAVAAEDLDHGSTTSLSTPARLRKKANRPEDGMIAKKHQRKTPPTGEQELVVETHHIPEAWKFGLGFSINEHPETPTKIHPPTISTIEVDDSKCSLKSNQAIQHLGSGPAESSGSSPLTKDCQAARQVLPKKGSNKKKGTTKGTSETSRSSTICKISLVNSTSKVEPSSTIDQSSIKCDSRSTAQEPEDGPAPKPLSEPSSKTATKPKKKAPKSSSAPLKRATRSLSVTVSANTRSHSQKSSAPGTIKKRRKDLGVKRGPYKKRNAPTQAARPSAGSAMGTGAELTSKVKTEGSAAESASVQGQREKENTGGSTVGVKPKSKSDTKANKK